MSRPPRSGQVIVWGCPTQGRLVRGVLPHGAKLPNASPERTADVLVDCTCGRAHRIEPMPRRRRAGECVDLDPVELRALRKRRH